MNQGDIYNVSLDPTVGREQQGQGPVLIVSATSFNQATGLAIVVPITGGGAAARYAGFAVPLSGLGLSVDGVVLCNQPRTLDLRARQAKRIGTLPQAALDDVLGRLQAILS